MNLSTSDLLALRTDPAALGRAAEAIRRAVHGDAILLRETATHEIPDAAARLSGTAAQGLAAWPDALTAGDRLVVAVDGSDDARSAYATWLRGIATGVPEGVAIAPCSRDDGALHRLWCVAAARLVLPAHVRVEARHDLLGIRLAQLALAMGADTLSGPVEPDRRLPMAGVARPNEATRAGLSGLVAHAGFRPVWDEATPARRSA